MGKREFLEMLGAKLIEELPRSLVLSHLQYYDEYISNEVRNGKKEAQVMEELGDPVMIAHTIINAATGESFQGDVEDAEFTEIRKEEVEPETPHTEKKVEYTHIQTEDYTQNTKPEKKKGFGQYGCLITAIIGVLILIAILSIVGGLISILWPVLLVAFLIMVIFGKKKQ